MSVARTEPGSSALMLGNRSRTLFATATAFAPAWRVTATTAVADGISYPRAQKSRLTRSSWPGPTRVARGRVGRVAEVHGRAVALTDDQRIVALRALELAARREEGGAAGPVELAGPGVAGPGLDRAGQVVHRNPPGRHRRGIGLDTHGRFAAEDVHAAHAG